MSKSNQQKSNIQIFPNYTRTSLNSLISSSFPSSPRTPSIGNSSYTNNNSSVPTPTTSTNYYYTALVSPIHQRFIDFERRVKGWRLFRHISTSKRSNHRSTSYDPSVKKSKEIRSSNNLLVEQKNSGSFTCPLSRKHLYMNLSGLSRPRPTLDTVSNSSDKSLSYDEVENRFKIIQENSGILSFGGKTFTGVKFSDLESRGQNSLGEGAGGSVSKYKFKGRSIAVKHMKRTDALDESKRIFMDLEVISKCGDCPYIVEYFGYIITYDFVYICMDVMVTCLDKLLAKRQKTRPADQVGLPEEIISKVALNVVRALDYLKEKHKIMHRDVKPSNILMDFYGNFKLCDFGISGKLIESKAATKVGCTGYMAPERLISDSPHYDVRADVSWNYSC
ncbi:Protein kinase domain-containing protein [Meloidogyne graminicola]|uniref:mitogen-activated protein kinase kinase n=1 Tax=Meloidogyne graminicola TaxID=189291 RepID=A0A8S9ZMF8_9BILA|nr:Protein kinase domain-containing protein [Meloidogyne graminicola]